MNKKIDDIVNQIDSALSPFFQKKLPSPPKDFLELIVKYGPYLLAIALVLSLGTLLPIFGIAGFVLPFVSTAHLGLIYFISLGFTFVTLIIQAIAIPGLLKRTASSWRLIFLSTLISTLQLLFTRDILGTALSAFISFYFLYQIKSFYKN